MLGIIVYAYFLFMGFVYASMAYREKSIYFRVWMGGIFGNLIMMAGLVPFAFVFKFNIISHILLIVAAAVPAAVIFIKRKNAPVPAAIPVKGKKAKAAPAKKNGFFTQMFSNEGEQELTHKIFLIVIVPVTLLICILMTNHILVPTDSGGVASGQSTYGDLAFHMGIITSMAEQGKFPPEYNILAGTKICYPFFINMLSASLMVFGTSLRLAVLIPSYVFSFLLVTGFYFLSHKLTGSRAVSVLAVLLFFFNGGFGFAYFFEGAKADTTAFTKIFTDYYHTPTNYNEMNIRWANTICDMIIPQRTTMAGWTVLLAALWLLADAFEKKTVKAFAVIGIVAGCMPMVHTHSFMGVGIISAVLCVAAFVKTADKKEFWRTWGLYAGIAAVLAVPQLLFWTFNQASGSGFTQIHFGWVNENDPDIWFWLKNWGVILLAVIPAFMNTSSRNKLFMAGGALIFAVAEIVQFQPLAYDNNKLFFVTYIIAVIITAEFLVMLYNKCKEIRGRQFIAAVTLAACFASGVLTIGREWYSGGMYQTFSKSELEFADFVKENTEKDAVFATYSEHLNPVSVLAGRSLYSGTPLFLTFHGFSEEQGKREKIVKSMYSASSSSELKKIAQEHDIEYIVVSGHERDNYTVNTAAFSGLEKVYSSDGIELYKIN